MKNEIIAVLNEYNSLGINQQLDYDKFYLYSIITYSTAIEGSTITEVENQVLLGKKFLTGFKNSVAGSMKNLKKLIQMTLKTHIN